MKTILAIPLVLVLVSVSPPVFLGLVSAVILMGMIRE